MPVWVFAVLLAFSIVISATGSGRYCFNCRLSVCSWTGQLKKLLVDCHEIWGICRLCTREEL